jgi:hypothetical protein
LPITKNNGASFSGFLSSKQHYNEADKVRTCKNIITFDGGDIGLRVLYFTIKWNDLSQTEFVVNLQQLKKL